MHPRWKWTLVIAVAAAEKAIVPAVCRGSLPKIRQIQIFS